MNKIKVPEGMLDAAIKGDTGLDPDGSSHLAVLESAMRWLSENPIKLTNRQALDVLQDGRWRIMSTDLQQFAVAVQDAQRIMFLAPEPEPEKDGTVVFEPSGRPSGVWYKGEILKTSLEAKYDCIS